MKVSLIYQKNRIIAVLLAIMMFQTLPALAQQEDGVWRRTIIIATLDGSTMEYFIDATTKVKVEKPNLIIETDGVVLNYELEKMGQVRYGRRFIPSSIGGVMVGNQPFKWKDETIFFDHLPDNTLIEVLTVDGKLVMSRKCSGKDQLSLQSLVNGVYLVKLNQTTYKILKR